MTRDATLDAFGTSQEPDEDPGEQTDPSETSEEERGGQGEEEGGEKEEGDGKITQAVEVTTDWTPAGATCAACGATVERRWQHQGALVCPDCKDWGER